MKVILLSIITLFVMCSANAQTINQTEYKSFYEHIEQGNWRQLRHYFQSDAEASQFLGHFSKSTIHPIDFNSFYAFRLHSLHQGNATFLNLSKMTYIDVLVEFAIQNSTAKVSNFTIADRTNPSLLRMESSAYEFVSLPTTANEKPHYVNSFSELYNENNSINLGDYAQDITFRQINFSPLKLKFDYCEKVLFFNICGQKTFTKDFEGVISDKDDPANENGYVLKNFYNIADVTAFRNQKDIVGFNPSQGGKFEYVLTAAIVDDQKRVLTIYREGVLPFTYGDEETEVNFTMPIAVKEIGGHLYVLDKGDRNNPPIIHVLDVFNTIVNQSEQGSFGVNYLGIISLEALGISGPKDIGGYTGYSTKPNQLLILDERGLSIVELQKTGLATVNQKFISKIVDPKDDNRLVSLNEAIKIDARNPKNAADLGNVILLTKQNEILSFTCSELEVATDFLNIQLRTDLDRRAAPNNLAYMAGEEKWYLTDFTGKLHKLDKEGRYVGGGGTFGMDQWNGDLYFPNAITPNPIGDDPTNDFRYRFMVANKWGYETGIKLFSPGIFVSKLKAFENLNSASPSFGHLTFAFTMSGKWGYIEGANSIKMGSVKINDVAVNPALWNTQINGGLQTDKSTEFLNHFPETIQLNPSAITSSVGTALALNRGWNTFTVNITVYSDAAGTVPLENVTKTIKFYWLPSSFTPTVTTTLADIQLNNSFHYDNGFNKDYLYKPIVLGDKAVYYNPTGHDIWVSEYGDLLVKTGATLFNSNYHPHGMYNFRFAEGGKIRAEAGSYLCVAGNTNYPDEDYRVSPSQFQLDKAYKKGINPVVAPRFSATEQSKCKSACVFLAGNAAVPTFKATVDLSNNNPFRVTVDPTGSTYYNKLKWEVEEVGNTAKKASLIVDASEAQIVRLNEKLTYNGLPYTFLSCKDYKVTLSVGCNDGNNTTEWVASSSQNIGIYNKIHAGPDQTVCEDISKGILGGARPVKYTGDTYTPKWTGPTGTSITDSTLAVGSYPSGLKNAPQTFTYTYTDKWGCAKSAAKKVTVYSLARATDITTPSILCQDQMFSASVVTDAITGATYKWQALGGAVYAEMGARALVSPTSGGQLNLVATITQNGCTTTYQRSVTVNPAPTVTLASPTMNVCKNSPWQKLTATVSPTGGVGTWSGERVTFMSRDNTHYFITDNVFPAKYTVLFNYKAPVTGCPKNVYQTIVVGPQIQLGPDQTVCQNSAAFVPSVTSPQGGTWSVGGVNLPNNTFDPATKALGAHTLTYTYKDAFNCTNSATKTVTVKGPYNVGLSPAQAAGLRYKYYENNTSTPWTSIPDYGKMTPVSEGTATTIGISPRKRDAHFGLSFEATLVVPTTGSYTLYLFSKDGSKLYLNNELFIANDFSHSITGIAKTTTLQAGNIPIRVDYFNNLGSNMQLYLQWSGPSIALQSIPSSAFLAPLTVCQGASLELTASTGTTFLWSNGNTMGPKLAVDQQGHYSVTVKDADGCAATSKPVLVSLLGKPQPKMVTSNGLSYAYYRNDGTEWTNLPDFGTLAPYATGFANKLDLSQTDRDANMGIVYDGYISIANDGSYTFYANSDDGSQLFVDDYLVVDNNGKHTATEKSGTVTLHPGMHKLKILYYNSATATKHLVISYQGPSIAKQVIPGEILFNDKGMCIGSGSKLGVDRIGTYSWNIAASTATIPFMVKGNYVVDVTYPNGCVGRASRDLDVAPLPTVSVASATPNYPCAESFTSAVFVADPNGVQPFKYQWRKAGVDVSGAVGQTHTFTTSGNYAVKLTDGCTATATSPDFLLDIITQPDFALVPTTTELCETGSPAKVRVDIDKYNNTKNYQVNFTPSPQSKTLNAAPVPVVTDAFSGYYAADAWKYRSTAAKEGSSIVNGNLTLAGQHLGMTTTGNDFTALCRDDLRGDLDVKVNITKVTGGNASARAGILLANDMNALNKGGYCLVSVVASNAVSFQYDANGDGLLDAANTLTLGTAFSSGWLRMVRSGKIFTAYYSLYSSPDTWVSVGSVAIVSAASSSQTGLFVSSHDINNAASCTFDNFTAVARQPLVEFPANKPGTFTAEVRDLTGANTCPVKSKTVTIGSKANPTGVMATLANPEVCSTSGNVLLTGGSPAGGKWSGYAVSRKLDDAFDDWMSLGDWKVKNTDNNPNAVINEPQFLQVSSYGADINQFVSIYREDIKGDFDVAVQVANLSTDAPNSLAGIMIANDFNNLASGGYAVVGATPSGFVFQYDVANPVGYPETNNKVATSTYGGWVRLKKSGNLVSAYYKLSESNSWTQIASAKTPLLIKTDVQVGLFGTAMAAGKNLFAQMSRFTCENAANNAYKFFPSFEAELPLTYTYTAANGCSASASTNIRVRTTLPTAFDLGADRTVRQGETVALSVTPAAYEKVLWSNGATTQNIVASVGLTEVVASKTIKATVSNACGSTSDEVKLLVPCPRSYSTNTTATIKTPVLGNYDGTEVVYSGGGVFDGIYTVVGNIRLQDGTYTFNSGSMLYVDDSKNIVVGDAAGLKSQNLVLKGATMTASCTGYSWGGIILGENSSITTDRDAALKNSEISHANIAVEVKAKSVLASAMSIKYTNFLNNYWGLRDIERSGYIKRTNLLVEQCLFDGNAPSRLVPSYSGFQYLCTSHIYLSNTEHQNSVVQNNTFRNSSYAVNFGGIRTGTSAANLSIKTNTFEYNGNGMYLDLAQNDANVEVVGNSISLVKIPLGNIGSYPYNGISVGASGPNSNVRIVNNQLRTSVGDPNDSYGLLGPMLGNQSEIKGNRFENFTYGIRFFQYPNDRLAITNNTFVSNKTGIDLNGGSASLGVNINCNEFKDDLGITDDVSIAVDNPTAPVYFPYLNSTTPIRNTFSNQSVAIKNVGRQPLYYYKAANEVSGTNTYVTFVTAYQSTPFGSVNCALTREDNDVAPVPSNWRPSGSDGFHMGQNIPNPAHNETSIPVFVPYETGKVEVEIRSIEAGGLLKKLKVDGLGEVHLSLGLNDLPAGVYFYSLVVEGRKLETKKLTVIR